MDKISISGTSNLANKSQEIVNRVVQGIGSTDEEYGYDWWWEVKTINGKSYKVSEAMKDAIANSTGRFITLPKGEVISTHQITSITKEYNSFGPRAGEA